MVWVLVRPIPLPASQIGVVDNACSGCVCESISEQCGRSYLVSVGVVVCGGGRGGCSGDGVGGCCN